MCPKIERQSLDVFASWWAHSVWDGGGVFLLAVGKGGRSLRHGHFTHIWGGGHTYC